MRHFKQVNPGKCPEDATYYVDRVTWGMIMAQRVKEETSGHVKWFH